MHIGAFQLHIHNCLFSISNLIHDFSSSVRPFYIWRTTTWRLLLYPRFVLFATTGIGVAGFPRAFRIVGVNCWFHFCDYFDIFWLHYTQRTSGQRGVPLSHIHIILYYHITWSLLCIAILVYRASGTFFFIRWFHVSRSFYIKIFSHTRVGGSGVAWRFRAGIPICDHTQQRYYNNPNT
jgi:hypothetical protein